MQRLESTSVSSFTSPSPPVSTSSSSAEPLPTLHIPNKTRVVPVSDIDINRLSAAMGDLIGACLSVLSRPLTVFAEVVPEYSPPVAPVEIISRPPSIGRKKRAALSVTTDHVDHPQSNQYGHFENTPGDNSSHQSFSPLQSSFAHLQSMNSTSASASIFSSSHAFPLLSTSAATSASKTKTLSLIRSFQVEPLAPLPPVITAVGGGALSGEAAVNYLGQKFELLQSIQCCTHALTCLSIYRHRRTTSNGSVEYSDSVKSILKLCQDFVHSRVMNAVMKGREGNVDVYQVRSMDDVWIYVSCQLIFLFVAGNL